MLIPYYHLGAILMLCAFFYLVEKSPLMPQPKMLAQSFLVFAGALCLLRDFGVI